MDTRMRVRIATILSAVVLSFFALGYWMGGEDTAEPLAWQERFNDTLWVPLKERRLELGTLERTLGEGWLWLISADGQPLLVSRYGLQSDGQAWRVQAVVELNAEQLDSLVQAQAWQPGQHDQPLSPAVGEALAAQAISRLSLIPAEAVDVEQIQATFGNPDMRLEVAEGEAWVYPKAGVVIAVTGEQAHSVMYGLQGGL